MDIARFDEGSAFGDVLCLKDVHGEVIAPTMARSNSGKVENAYKSDGGEAAHGSLKIFHAIIEDSYSAM